MKEELKFSQGIEGKKALAKSLEAPESPCHAA